MNHPDAMAAVSPLEESITLQQAKKLIQCMAHEQSFLLLAPPGVGKSDMVFQAARNKVRPEIQSFIRAMPDALMRPVPPDPAPFSTPRAWALLSRALDLAQGAGVLTRETRRALAFGRLSAEDAAVFCALAEELIGAMQPPAYYVEHPDALPKSEAGRWFILNCIRQQVRDGTLLDVKPRNIDSFLRGLPPENQLTLLTDLVERWGELGADKAMFDLLKSVAQI